VAEAASNGQLEIIRCNSGGYFQSDDILKLKLGMTITSVEKGWAKITGRVEESHGSCRGATCRG
jgi:hypothetical protein